jgi:hypothetical protein
MSFGPLHFPRRQGHSPGRNLLLTFNPIDLERDAACIITYAKDLFAISFGGSSRFDEQFVHHLFKRLAAPSPPAQNQKVAV